MNYHGHEHGKRVNNRRIGLLEKSTKNIPLEFKYWYGKKISSSIVISSNANGKRRRGK